MGKVVKYEVCPRCRQGNRDSRGDNLLLYSDGSGHCFACGYHLFAKARVSFPHRKLDGNENKAVLPFDFERQLPAAAWRWLLQYGLSYTYWLPYVGWSESSSRLVFTVGTPFRFSIGRYIKRDDRSDAGGDRKWRLWGDRSEYVEVLGDKGVGPIILVEDIISAHKVSQVATCIPLFGTKVLDGVLSTLKRLGRPVSLWLDADQYTLLPPKIGRLQTFLEAPVRYISTELDPKQYELSKIKELINEPVQTS